MAGTSTPHLLFLALFFIALLFSQSEAQSGPPLVPGLSYTFYKSTCPNLETVVRNYLTQAFKNNTGLPAALLRVHFHDCFVQGCDASVLLDGSASGPGEQQAPPNLTLRPEAFKAINDLRALIDKACGTKIVSCADIAALAARDSVSLSGGPNYAVPYGRRDGLNFATRNATLAFLPRPQSNVSELMAVLSKLNLSLTDLVTLSGGHTIGRSHCGSFPERIFPTRDPNMDQTFFKNLRLTCPTNNTDNTTVLDIRTPNVFDNKYYVDLLNRQGLLTSDQVLYTDSTTKSIVTSFAINQSLFFEQFAVSVVKMGMISVLTGTQGEIRTNCSARNSGASVDGWSIVDILEGAAEAAASF